MLRMNLAADVIPKVRALNGMFLEYLQGHVRAGGPSLGLSPASAAALAGLSQGELERLAALPRALFRVDLDAAVADCVVGLPASAHEQQRRALNLTVVLTLAELTRSRSSLAEFFFGLTPEAQRRLLEWPLAAYPRLAEASNLLRCAFIDARALWPTWLAQRQGRGMAHELALLAMQPEVPARAEAAAALRCLA
jgi:hypothetical protein